MNLDKIDRCAVDFRLDRNRQYDFVQAMVLVDYRMLNFDMNFQVRLNLPGEKGCDIWRKVRPEGYPKTRWIFAPSLLSFSSIRS